MGHFDTMSKRLHPLFQPGNPQLRVFLPNFVVKLLNPRDPLPPNVVQFEVSIEMTKFDIKNYLEKIYKIPVRNITTHVRMGKFKRTSYGGHLIKDDDFKVAYVTMPEDCTFEFPDLYPKEVKEKEDKEMEQFKELKKE